MERAMERVMDFKQFTFACRDALVKVILSKRLVAS